MQLALTVLHELHPERVTTLATVVAAMDPTRLRGMLRALPTERAAAVAAYLQSLTRDQLSAIHGLGTRLAIISESHTGEYLRATEAIDLRGALRGEEVVVFSLNSSRYGQLAAQLGTLAVQDLVAASGHRLDSGEPSAATVAIDEFSALGADNVLQLLARGREAGVSVLLVTQELADLDRAGRGLRDQVLGNTALKLVHRQDVPASARTVAEIGGTEQRWSATYDIGRGPFGSHQRRGTRRLTEEFIVDPNTIRTLPTGALVRIRKTPTARTHVMRVTQPRDRGLER